MHVCADSCVCCYGANPGPLCIYQVTESHPQAYIHFVFTYFQQEWHIFVSYRQAFRSAFTVSSKQGRGLCFRGYREYLQLTYHISEDPTDTACSKVLAVPLSCGGQGYPWSTSVLSSASGHSEGLQTHAPRRKLVTGYFLRNECLRLASLRYSKYEIPTE